MLNPHVVVIVTVLAVVCATPFNVTLDCKCGEFHCPNATDSCSSPFGYCYLKATIDGTKVKTLEYGCLESELLGNLCYSGHDSPDTRVECCNTTYCNNDTDAFISRIETELEKGKPKPPKDYTNVLMVALGAGVTLVVVIVIGTIYKCIKYNSKSYDKLPSFLPLNNHKDLIEPVVPYNEEHSLSNTSGAGKTQFVQRTIAKQAQLIERIGKGRYGEVWKALWRGDPVAVKQFDPRDEHSWLLEVKMYETNWLRHENILGYIGSDCKDTVSSTRWLIMFEYCQHGSLHDYLQNNKYTPLQLLESVRGIFSGLEHLHSAIYGNQHSKPEIAHRDLKTKNIMVKYQTHCCIGDLGLAINSATYNGVVNKSNCQVGTRRYMPPEIIRGDIDVNKFSSFLAADMFSASYVLWEMAHRVVIDNELSEPVLPYIEKVPGDPTIEDMRSVVVDGKQRPTLPDRWKKNAITRELGNIIEELWYEDPRARLTSLRIKKTLTEMSLHQQDSLSAI